MLDTGIDIQGLKDLEKALIEIGEEIGQKKSTGMMTLSMREGAEEFKKEILSTAPESNKQRSETKRVKPYNRSGYFKSKVKIRSSTNRRASVNRKFGKDVVSLVKVGVFRVFYSPWLEFGNSHQPANPIIRRAFLKKTQPAMNIINQRLARRVTLAQRRIARKHNNKGR